MTQRRVCWLIAGSVGLFVAAAVWMWFGSVGTGEFRTSPDGRFIAHVSNLSTGTWAGDREHYIEVRVEEAGSGREVWRVVRSLPAGAAVPDYGDRATRFLVWADDSSAVTVPMGDSQPLVLAVP